MSEEQNREEMNGSYRISREDIPRDEVFNTRAEGYQPRYGGYGGDAGHGGDAGQSGYGGSYHSGGYHYNGTGKNNEAGPNNGTGLNNGTGPYNGAGPNNGTGPYNGTGPNNGTGPYNGTGAYQGSSAYSGGNYYGAGNAYGGPQPYRREEKKKKPKKQGGFLKFCKLVGAAAIFGLIAGGVFQGVNLTADYIRGTVSTKGVSDGSETVGQISGAAIPATPVLGQPRDRETDVTAVVESTMPSIVAITSTVTQSYQVWGQIYDEDVSGSGSGIIIGKNEKELLVATNNHVVEGAKTIGVLFIDNETVEAEVKGTDKTTDLAVIAIKIADIKKDTLNKIKVAAIGDSDSLKVGERVVAIGNALGYGQSVTVGYVSAKNRKVQIENKSMELLQTDAAINPGNSGGALLNMNGEVIGINSVKMAETAVEGIGYAIPISKAIPIINELMEREVITEEEKGYLGVTLEDVTEAENKYNMPPGAFVTAVAKEGAAKEAGILAGDIITKVNGTEVGNRAAVQERIGAYRYGTKVKITLMRYENGKYKEKELTATLKKIESLKDLEEEQPNSQLPDKGANPAPFDGKGNEIPYNDFFDFFNQYSR